MTMLCLNVCRLCVPNIMSLSVCFIKKLLVKVGAFAWYSVKIRVIFGVRFERQKVDKKSKPTQKLKHANSILESFEYFCQISSKSIVIILSYTVSKFARFLRQCSTCTWGSLSIPAVVMARDWTNMLSKISFSVRPKSPISSKVPSKFRISVQRYLTSFNIFTKFMLCNQHVFTCRPTPQVYAGGI